MSAARAARVAGRTSLPLAIAALFIGAFAGPAAASTNFSVSPSSVTSNQTVTATGTDTAPCSSSLVCNSSSRTLKITVALENDSTGKMTDSSSSSASPTSAGKVVYSLDTSCPSWSANPCAPTPNGTYQFTFTDGSSSTSKTAEIDIPPAAVGSFSGSGSSSASSTLASFSWAQNAEPDTFGYDITGPSGDVARVNAVDVCNAGSCAVNVQLDPSYAGTTQQFTIYAMRYTSPGSGNVESSGSNTQVSFPAAPTPAPSPSPSGGSGGSSGSGSGGGGGSSTGTGSGSAPSSGSGSGGTGTGSAKGTGSTGGTSSSGAATGGKTTRHGGTLAGKSSSAALRSVLPMLATAGAAPDLPSMITEVQPLPEGTYNPRLAYPDQTIQQALTQRGKATNTASVVSDITRVLNKKALLGTLAAAIVLLLCAAHLRAWVNRADLDYYN